MCATTILSFGFAVPAFAGEANRADATQPANEQTAPARGDNPRMGIGRDVVLDRVIVDKNARVGDGCRLVNEAGVQNADGDGYYIRDGIIVVPKDGVIKPGTIV